TGRPEPKRPRSAVGRVSLPRRSPDRRYWFLISRVVRVALIPVPEAMKSGSMGYRACLLSLAASLTLCQEAMAVCGVPHPRLVCAEYFASPLIVEATLTQADALQDKDDPEGISAHVYTLTVTKVVRGKSTGT